MAKVYAPLFSFGASGKLANALVYFPWKGIQSVRQYVIPANPKTDPQKAQRAHMTAAVLEWHGADYNTIDRGAWRVFAGTLTKIMAGFNAMCRVHILEGIAGNTWERISDITIPLFAAAAIDVECHKVSGGNTPDIHYGTSKLYMPNTEAMADQTGDIWAGTLLGLLPNTGYFFWIDCGTPGTDYGRTGIAYQRTSAA